MSWLLFGNPPENRNQFQIWRKIDCIRLWEVGLQCGIFLKNCPVRRVLAEKISSVLLLNRTQVWPPAPVRQFTNPRNCSSRGSPGATALSCANTYTQTHTNVHTCQGKFGLYICHVSHRTEFPVGFCAFSHTHRHCSRVSMTVNLSMSFLWKEKNKASILWCLRLWASHETAGRRV